MNEEQQELLREVEAKKSLLRLQKARKSLEGLLNHKGKYVTDSEAMKIEQRIRSIDKILSSYGDD